jgi:outer membrane immunogenic protein
MRRILASTTIVSAITFSAVFSMAQAADIPRKSVPVVQPTQALPLFTWTGLYVGVNGGYAFQTGQSRLTGSPGLLATGFAPLGRANTLGNGFTVGGTVGYNYQIGNIVAGIEGDLNYLDLGKRVTSINGPLVTSTSQESTYLGTVRGRLGVAFDRLLIYGTGGLAFGDQKARTTISGLGSEWTGSKDDTRFGYAVGGGAEYALTNNWSAKIEYLYYDLGRRNFSSPLTSGAGAGAGVFGQTRAENNGNIVRAGINYRF